LLHFQNQALAADAQRGNVMSDLTISKFEITTTGNMRRPSFGKRFVLWLEIHQQVRADREIAQILRLVRH
jgi:hypothetical protein